MVPSPAHQLWHFLQARALQTCEEGNWSAPTSLDALLHQLDTCKVRSERENRSLEGKAVNNLTGG